MFRTRAAVIATTALALALTPLAGAQAAETDPYHEARETFLAASVLAEHAAKQYGFRLDYQSREVGKRSSTYDITLWADAILGTAAAKAVVKSGNFEAKSFQGTRYDLDAAGAGGTQAWTQLNPRTKSDDKVMANLPRGTRYSVGAAPALTNAAGSLGFTFDQVLTTASYYAPWADALLIAMCDETAENPTDSYTCTGSVETISGQQKKWRFTIEQNYGVSPTTVTNLVAKSDSKGHLVSLTTESEIAGVIYRSTSKADIRNTDVPTPDIRSSNSVASERFTGTAAYQDAKSLSRAFRTQVKALLDEAGKKVTPRNVLWAEKKIYQQGGPSYLGGQNSWSDGYGWYFDDEGKRWVFSADASDGITVSTRFAVITVHHGKMYSIITDTQPDRMMAIATTRSTEPNRMSPPAPWGSPA